jgi:surface protein
MMDIIYGGAFKNCTNLEEINIPVTLTHLDHYAFNGTKLFNDNKDEDGAVYYDGCLIYYPLNKNEGTYEVKAGTRLLASYVFSGDVYLKGLILPEGLECICKYALDGMQRLETLSLPSSLTHVADGFCTNARKLSSIYCYLEAPFDLAEVQNCFQNVNQSLCTLYVPAGSRNTYQAANIWKDFPIIEMEAVYTVTFLDYDGSEISEQKVPKGASAIKPNDPQREGYNFTGWDKSFTNVQSDLTVTAQYERETFSVLFVDGYTDDVIDTQYIPYGGSATEPEALDHDGYAFIGWDKEFDVITENTIVTAQYIEGDGVVSQVYDAGTRTVTFYYDKKLVMRPGIMEIFTPSTMRFESYYNKVFKAVIDPSMQDADLTSTSCMFSSGINFLTNLTSIEGLENLNTSNVTDMSSMFSMCQSLTSLDLSTFDTKKVTNMNDMFGGCSKLQMVDVTSFDISNVTDMGGMFMGCQKLRTICCFGNWSNTTAKTDYMFFNCKNLVGSQGTLFDKYFTDATYARPDGGTSSPGYFTAETMTGIQGLKGQWPMLNGQSVYNLSGQRLSKPKKGINIVGGKKVLIK